MRRIAVLAVLFALAFAASAETTTVILVRHAEKAGTSGDVPLTEGGVERAKELARALSDAKIDRIYVTQWIRTLQTVEPLVAKIKVEPVKFQTGDTYARDIAAHIRKNDVGKTVLVAGHSNTTVDVLRELGMKDPPFIPEPQFDDLFVCTLAGGEAATCTALRYGAVTR